MRLLRRAERERSVEEYFVDRVAESGGWSVKVKGVSENGFFDRITFWPHIPAHFVEMKCSKGVLSGPQQRIHKRVREEFNQPTFTLYTRQQVDDYIERYAPSPKWRELYAELGAACLSE